MSEAGVFRPGAEQARVQPRYSDRSGAVTGQQVDDVGVYLSDQHSLHDPNGRVVGDPQTIHPDGLDTFVGHGRRYLRTSTVHDDRENAHGGQ